MSETWILAETRDRIVKPVSFELASAARSLGDGSVVTAVLVGAASADLVPALAAHGADQVLVLDDARLDAYSPDGWARALAEAARQRQPATILGAATTRGRELTARLAAELDVGLASDVIALSLADGQLEAVRPIYAGRAIARVRVTSRPRMATVRPGSYAPCQETAAGEPVRLPVADYGARAVATSMEAAASARPDVAEADIIVTGGRGMGGPEHFALIEALADELGAAVGASRAVVDAGWRPHSEQVGQTGKTVSPSLYVACGVSGAMQHLAGMKTSKRIVAVNKDPEAPIFLVADYGVIGDVFEVLPALTEAIRQLKSS